MTSTVEPAKKTMRGKGEPMKLEKFKTDFFNQMKTVWEEKRCCDVTVVIADKKFQCHRLILSLASNYFQKLFYSDFKEKNSDEVTLQDVDVESFEKILGAIYTGEIDLHAGNLYQILKTSSFLNITAIEEACVSYIRDENYVDHIFDICLLANTIGQRELLTECVNHIAMDLVLFSKVEAFRNLPFEVLKLILRQASVCKNDENTLLLAIIQWNKFNEVETKVIKMLLSAAKLTKISPAIMASLIVTPDKDTDFEEEQIRKKLKLCEGFECVDSTIPTLNAYVRAINVKTGAKGVAVFKLSKREIDWNLDSFDEFSHESILKVITVGNAHYVLTCAEKPGRNLFIQNTCGKRTILKSPSVLWKRFHAVADDSNIYFFSLEPLLNSISVYNCNSNEWNTIPVPNYIMFTKHLTVALVDSKIYIFNVEKSYQMISLNCNRRYHVCCFHCRTSSFSFIGKMPFSHKDAAACAHNGKIYLYGCQREDRISNKFSAFDVTTVEWNSLKHTYTDRTNSYRLVCYDGFIYLLQHQPFEKLEKYNIDLNKWFGVPAIPAQSSYCDQVVSTGQFLDAEVAVYSFSNVC